MIVQKNLFLKIEPSQEIIEELVEMHFVTMSGDANKNVEECVCTSFNAV